MKHILAFAFVLLTATLAASESTTWRHLDIRGMGFVTGVLVHPLAPGHTYLKTDVGGVFRWLPDETRWINLTDPIAEDIESIAVDRLNAQSIVFAAEGQVWRSSDAGLSWHSTGMDGVYMNGNGDLRRAGERLVVDSSGSSSVLWFGSRRDGLWRKVDDGEWNQIPTSSVPVGTHNFGVSTVAVDHGSASGQASAQIIYAGVMGAGIYRSSNGGDTWARMTDWPAADGQEPVRMVVASDGTLYLTCMGSTNDYSPGTGSAWRYRAGTWSAITPRSGTAWGPLDVHPTNPERIVMATYGSSPNEWIYRSDDAGESWSEVSVGTPEVPVSWPSWHLWGWSGNLAIDSQNPDRLWMTTGFGVLTTADHRSESPDWHAPMHGVEELVVNHARILPTGEVVVGVADKFGYHLTDADGIVSSVFPDAFGITTGIDWSVSDGQTLIHVGSDQNNGNPIARMSRNAGATWQHLNNPNPDANYNGVFGGNIAIASDDADSFVWAPQTASWADNGKGPPGVWYTRNGGESWAKASGLPDRINQLDQHWFPSTVLVSDRVAAGTFYLVTGNANGAGRLYRSNDYGATWSERSSDPYDRDYKTTMVANPSVAGELWIAYGSASNRSLHRSSDGGDSWTWLAGLEEVRQVALGAPAPGRSNPAVFIGGRIDGVTGIWRSDDVSALSGSADDATWVRISSDTMPLRSVNNLGADPTTHGRVIVCTSGRGAFLIELNSQLRLITFTAPVGATAALNDGIPVDIPADFDGLDPDADHPFTLSIPVPAAAQ